MIPPTETTTLDLSSADRTYTGLTWLARTFEELRLIDTRSRAIDELARMIHSGKPSETMRRACKQVLIACSDAQLFKQGEKKRKRGGRPPKLPQARELLKHILDNGPLPANHVLQLAHQLGISRRTIQQAKDQLGVTSHRIGFILGAGFSWRLPNHARA